MQNVEFPHEHQNRVLPRFGGCLPLQLIFWNAAMAESSALCMPELSAAFPFCDVFCGPSPNIEIESNFDFAFKHTCSLVLRLVHALMPCKIYDQI